VAQTIYVGSTVRITANFQYWSSAATPVIQDPVTATATISDQNDNVLYSVTPVRQDVGIYYMDWTPPGPGTFIVNFVGVFSDGSQNDVTTVLNAIGIGSELGIPNSLEDDYYIEFYVNIFPLYIDPYDIQLIFPAAPLDEIFDLVYQYSQEANEITGIQNLAAADIPPEGMSWMVQAPYPSVTPFIREFVQANVCCALTRIYDPAQGADDLQVMLADLQVTRRYSVKATVNRITATTWCEIAGVLREELYRTTKFSGMRSVIRGSKTGVNPIPDRKIKHQEWVGWYPGRPWNRGNKFDNNDNGWYN
jgi:hypothetical protein